MNPQPLLLPLSSKDAGVVLDALVELSRYDGPDEWLQSQSKFARQVIDRILSLQRIELETSRQALLALGIGIARGKPQG